MKHAEPLYRTESVRAIDRAACAHGGLGGYALMCRAGAAALAALHVHWPRPSRVLIVCGGGNNGGDGLVLARLAQREGWPVAVLLADARAPVNDEAKQAHADWRAEGGEVRHWQAGAALPAADVIVDALFGIGLRRAPEHASAALIDAINAHGAPVFALDVPSGVDADSGAVPGVAVRAQRTLSFIVGKRGLHTGAARTHCGRIDVARLDVADAVLAAAPPDAWLLREPWLAPLLGARPADAHKGDHGHVLALGGDLGYGGALRLCAEAALRTGAGLVSAVTRSAHVAAMLAARPEIMVHGDDAGDVDAALHERATVLALGPGLGRGDWGRRLFEACSGDPRPRVLDADALNLLAAAPRAVPAAVLTPHPGEAARMLGTTTVDVQRDRYAALAALVERYAAVVVLKGAGTLVGAPGETPRAIPYGNPGLASGGTGDVLTGVIAGLLAQGLQAFDAASGGALLHALAGDDAARDGMRGMLASDLLPWLRRRVNPA